MNRRLKVYGRAIPVLLVITIIFGAAAQLGGELYRKHFYDEGTAFGFGEGYTYGGSIGYNYGLMEGYYAGLQEGYYYGVADGKIQTYATTIIDMENPYHIAALELEKKHMPVDVLLLTTRQLRTQNNQVGIIVYLVLPPNTTDTSNVRGWGWAELAAYQPELVEDVMTMIESVWNHEPYIKLVLTTRSSVLTYCYAYEILTYSAQNFFAGKWLENEPHSAQEAKIAGSYQVALVSMYPWPLNPYYLERMDQEKAKQSSSGNGSSDSNPK